MGAIQETSGGDHPAQVEGLKPCPFCGAPAGLYGSEPEESGILGYWIACSHGCQNKGQRTAVIAAWNRRASAPQEGWRQIESAPKDGTRVILLLPHTLPNAVEGYWRHDFPSLPGMWCVLWQAVHPTHWMPLPPAPEARQERENG